MDGSISVKLKGFRFSALAASFLGLAVLSRRSR